MLNLDFRKYSFYTGGLALYFAVWYMLFREFGMNIFIVKYSSNILIWHLVSSLVFALSSCVFWAALSRKLFLGLFLGYSVFPLFGAGFGGAIMLSIFFQKKMNLLTDFHEEDKALSKKMDSNLKTKTYQDSISDNMSVEPLVETIRSHSNADLKRGAIETLTQISNPQSVALLKECISDPNTEVRFYASSGLSRIEERLNNDIVKYKNKIKNLEHPEGDDYYNLGKSYYEFIYLEIQDAASLEYYMNEAIKAFTKAYEILPTNNRIRESLERALTKSGRLEEARKLKKTDVGEDENLIYKAESYFREGKFAECQEVMKQLGKEEFQWEAIRDVKSLWLMGLDKSS
ncbi:MAG: HEAT repeat domain-containing protein [Planctomycetes bacterium]|nr:HEAT repeat domain-containing protein [Planctomycetota bacterium]